jgi:hypothetical protein
MHTLIGVSLVSLLVSAGAGVPPTGPITPDETDQVHEWPAVKQGVWSIEGTLKPKRGKAKKWKSTTKRCDDAATLFQGYWGRGKADKDSCLFQSTKISGSKYEIVGECLVEQYDVVKSESVVTTKGQDSFEMKVSFQHGKVDAKATEVGHWVSACTEADKAAAAAAAPTATASVTPPAPSKPETEAAR